MGADYRGIEAVAEKIGEANEEYYRHRDDIVLFDELDDASLSWPAIAMYREGNANPSVAGFAEVLAAHLREDSPDGV